MFVDMEHGSSPRGVPSALPPSAVIQSQNTQSNIISTYHTNTHESDSSEQAEGMYDDIPEGGFNTGGADGDIVNDIGNDNNNWVDPEPMYGGGNTPMGGGVEPRRKKSSKSHRKKSRKQSERKTPGAGGGVPPPPPPQPPTQGGDNYYSKWAVFLCVSAFLLLYVFMCMCVCACVCENESYFFDTHHYVFEQRCFLCAYKLFEI